MRNLSLYVGNIDAPRGVPVPPGMKLPPDCPIPGRTPNVYVEARSIGEAASLFEDRYGTEPHNIRKASYMERKVWTALRSDAFIRSNP